MSTYPISQMTGLLTEPLVRAGICATQEQALTHVVLEYVNRKIVWVQGEVRRLEEKHGHSFADLSQARAGRASIADEDDWTEWVSLLDILEGWRQIKMDVQGSDAG